MPQVVEAGAIPEGDVPLRIGRPDALWHHVQEVTVALLAGPQQRVALVLAQQLRLRLELFLLEIEIDEHLRLRAENVRIEGLHQIVDRPLGVAAKDVGGVASHRRDEDDRNVAAARPLLDQAGGLKPVQARHLDVQQDEREVAPQELPERLLARGGGDQLVPERGEDRLQRHHVRGVVIHQQDAGALRRGRGRFWHVHLTRATAVRLVLGFLLTCRSDVGSARAAD